MKIFHKNLIFGLGLCISIICPQGSFCMSQTEDGVELWSGYEPKRKATLNWKNQGKQKLLPHAKRHYIKTKDGLVYFKDAPLRRTFSCEEGVRKDGGISFKIVKQKTKKEGIVKQKNLRSKERLTSKQEDFSYSNQSKKKVKKGQPFKELRKK